MRGMKIFLKVILSLVVSRSLDLTSLYSDWTSAGRGGGASENWRERIPCTISFSSVIRRYPSVVIRAFLSSSRKASSTRCRVRGPGDRFRSR